MTASGAAAAPAGSAGRRPLIDHGAIVAGWVGVGMAVTIAVSFLLVIPIEPIFWLLAPPVRPAHRLLREPALADRRAGPWRRILVDAALRRAC